MRKLTAVVDSQMIFRSGTPIVRLVSTFSLACAALLPGAALAQTSTLPMLVPTQILSPTQAETYPPGATLPAQLGFGGRVAMDEKSIVVSMVGYNNQTGRIAVFGKGADDQWVRTGTIDPTPQIESDFFGLTLVLKHDYLMTTADTGTFLFRKDHGTWTQTDKLDGVQAWAENGQTIDPPWAFIVGDVYRIDHNGTLQRTAQTLYDEYPPGQNGFGGADAAEGDTLAIADASYNSGQGEVFVYTLRNGQWVQKQVIISADGAPGDSFGIGVSLSGDLMAIVASGKNYQYEDPACPGTNYTGGATYVYKRINGWWTEQQEIDAQCLAFGIQVSVNEEWLAVNGQYYTEVYRRSHDERGPVTYAPFGLAGSGDPLSLFGSTLLLSGEGSVELPPGTVDVYDLRKQASQSSSQP